MIDIPISNSLQKLPREKEMESLSETNQPTPQIALSSTALAKHIYIVDVMLPSTVYQKKCSYLLTFWSFP